MEWGILVPVIAILMGPVMYLLYLKEMRLKQSHKLEDRDVSAQAARIDVLEQRMRVLERIVTDSGVNTAAQIEALRDHSVEPFSERERVRSP